MPAPRWKGLPFFFTISLPDWFPKHGGHKGEGVPGEPPGTTGGTPVLPLPIILRLELRFQRTVHQNPDEPKRFLFLAGDTAPLGLCNQHQSG